MTSPPGAQFLPAPYPIPDPVPLVHITDVSNLRSILSDGGLYSHAKLEELGRPHKDIAYGSIQWKRAQTVVPCGSGGCLHNYVPMFFWPRPPMLLAIKSGQVAGAIQDTVVTLITWLPKVQLATADFVFTEGHGIVATTQFFTDVADLDKVDWPLMREKYWRDTQQDGDRKRRRQAEFLVHDFLPWSTVDQVGTFNANVAAEVEAAFQAQGGNCEVPVKVQRGWYYA